MAKIEKIESNLTEKEKILLNTIGLTVEALDTIGETMDKSVEGAKCMIETLKLTLEQFNPSKLADAIEEDDAEIEIEIEEDEDDEEIDDEFAEILMKSLNK